jgi:RNA polymerase sigma factor, sigma-70 family
MLFFVFKCSKFAVVTLYVCMSNYDSIIKGVRKCDSRSQIMFYDLFFHSVYRSAYLITENESEAEEIAQDTMLKVFGRTDLLNDDKAAMERLLRRIASNAAIDIIRKRKDIIFSDETISDTEDVEMENSEYDYSIEDIREGIATLSDGYRNLITLRLFEDMSFNEVADVMNINCSTARVQYTRGIAKLKELLIKKRSYV